MYVIWKSKEYLSRTISLSNLFWNLYARPTQTVVNYEYTAISISDIDYESRGRAL